MKLNAEQQLAVETIDGPVLVVAGPGTGKTQLLAARVENILRQTDADPSNILCLTFTNDGARNMRERLRGIIGEASYKITVGTYHEFGAGILRDYPEYFLERRYLTLIDDLKSYRIFNGLTEEMSYANPLGYKEWGVIRSLVGNVKQAALTPDDLREIATENKSAIFALERAANEIFPPRMPSKLEQALPLFNQWLGVLSANNSPSTSPPSANPAAGPLLPPPLAHVYLTDLKLAMAQAEALGKATPLNKYKAEIMERVDDAYRLKAEKSTERLMALADVYEKYNNLTKAEGLYDYNDIILAAIKAIEEYDDLRAELQEKYQYVLLDEYQDTNAAQSRIVELLLDNPVWEGRPNVLAVGDDDQAIYAFQGALSSNLTDFYRRYQDVKLINLSKNYRSAESIVDFAASFRQTIADSVYKGLAGRDKELVAAGAGGIAGGGRAVIERIDFKSDVAERNWVAERIKELLAAGERPSETAVLARYNSELESGAKQLGGGKIRYQ
ncbi:ATP-dependent helicase, partial [Candidatus Saccharibacteria bacterium]|nr:ATP-dependent helicase [Candidatus Saccharibacteria bacterium]